VAEDADRAGEVGLLSAADDRKRGVRDVAEDGVVGLDDGAAETNDAPAVDRDKGKG